MILTIDPGKTTGYALGNFNESDRTIRVVEYGELRTFGTYEFATKLQALIGLSNRVVIERFHNAGPQMDTSPLLVTGAVFALAAVGCPAVKRIDYQQPDVPAFITKRFSETSVLTPALVGSQHAYDAITHLWDYFYRRCQCTTIIVDGKVVNL